MFTPRQYDNVPFQATLSSLPQPYQQDVLPEIKTRISSLATPLLIVLDDDPTGTQTCHNIAVLTQWTVPLLQNELSTTTTGGFFILTNSRALPPSEAKSLISEICQNLAKAAKLVGKEYQIVLRGDSTLRGHFPEEPEAVEALLGIFDAWILAPFFYQGGRYTIDDVHYVREGGILVPASQTPFAQDATFGYKSSNLRDYVLEKAGSRFKDEDICSITLENIRLGGSESVAGKLIGAKKGSVIVVNAAEESDMAVFAAGALLAEQKGKRFLYRTGAAFVSARLGITSIPPLSLESLYHGPTQDLGAIKNGGLIIAGSYVPKTTAQLQRLREARGRELYVIELDVASLINTDKEADRVLDLCIRDANQWLKDGKDVLVMTSRKLIVGHDALSSLSIGGAVAAALVKVVQNITIKPRYIIGKGGITSSDAATKGLNMQRAMVIGQAAPGVPLWKCEESTSKHSGVPYVVFPGNVGDEDTLANLVERWAIQS
ncbi:hypothetical protein BGZ60DRAFT_434499 [Tricladium varicosporioides]|nr:hypothetical protein BGZ60DRAFT_434499 [Hymenoscyphus varicosporioides]